MTNKNSLKDFVAETLAQIISGIRAAQKTDDGDHICPQGIRIGADHAPKKYLDTSTGHLVQMIDFDVAVTVSEASSVEGGIGISVIPLKLGAKGETESENSAVSRVRFSVPLAMPEAEYDVGYRPNTPSEELTQ